MKKHITYALVAIFVAHLLFRIYTYRTSYLTPYDPAFWKQLYTNSQWSTTSACRNLDPHFNPYTCVWDDHWYDAHKNDKNAIYLKKQSISDDGVYTYAGWEYIHGHDPTTLNAELPPFGKYLIGLSEVVFHNQNAFSLISGLFALFAFYLFSLHFFKNKLLAFIPVLLFSFEPLFYTQLQAPLLDTLYLGLLLLTFYFFFKKKYAFSALSLGLMAGTKAAISTFPLVIGVLIIYCLITRQRRAVVSYLYRLPIAGIVFVLTYLQYFLLGHSFREFLGVQKWIYVFYSSGAKGAIIAPWEMFATGHWHTWWGTYAVVKEWNTGWLILLVLSLITFVFLIIKRSTKPILLSGIWTFSYLIFLSFVPTWPRYLLVVLPFLYNLVSWGIISLNGKHETT